MGEQTNNIQWLREAMSYGMALNKRRRWYSGEGEDASAASTSPDADTSTPTDTDTAPDNSGNTPSGASSGNSSTAWLAARLERAKSQAVKALLEELGVEDAKALKGQLAKLAELEQAQLTEQEKLQNALQAEQQKRETAEQKLAEMLSQMKRSQAAAAIREAARAANAQYPEDIVAWVERGDTDLTSLLDEDGNAKTEDIKGLIEQACKERPTWFGGQTPGSPSNEGGQMPEPDAKTQQQAQAETRSRLRRWA